MDYYCSICRKEIRQGKFWTTDGRSFHVECFRCAACDNLLTDGDTCLKNGKYYCKKDFLAKWGILCKNCGKYLNSGEQYLEFEGNSYHKLCMTCSLCTNVIYIGSKFYTSRKSNGKLWCGVCVDQNRDFLEPEEQNVGHHATSAEIPPDPKFISSSAREEGDTVDSSTTKSLSSSQLIGGKRRKGKYTAIMKSIFGVTYDLLL